MPPIICEAVGCTNHAKVHFTQLEGGKQIEIHLCERCAEKQGVTNLQHQHDALQQILASMEVSDQSEGRKDATCPECGMTIASFRSSGRLGCAQDYHAFREELLPLIERVHDAAEHQGKTPRHAGESIRQRREIQGLRDQLQKAVAEEQYERAAELRDRIRRAEEHDDAAG